MARRAFKLPNTYALCVSRSGRYLAALGRNVVIANLEARKRLGSTHPLSHPSSLDFSPDDRLLVVKSTWGEVALLDTQSGERLAGYRPKQQDEGAAIHFTAEGNDLVDASWSGEIRVRSAPQLDSVQAFRFPGEMIRSVSRNEAGDWWLFVHTTKWKGDAVETPPPYLTLWRWPLSEPHSKLDIGMSSIDVAALAPTAPYIAVRGFCRDTNGTVLRLLSTDGVTLASVSVDIATTANRTRWSPDSKLLGTVCSNRFLIYSVPDLRLRASFSAEYAADLAFIEGGAEVVLGTWSGGWIAPMPPDEGHEVAG